MKTDCPGSNLSSDSEFILTFLNTLYDSTNDFTINKH